MADNRNSRGRSPRVLPIGGLLGDRLRALGIDEKVREYSAPLVWAELVGPQIANATEVDRVKDGVLYIHTRTAMWSHELSYHKADILRRLNDRVGARAGEPVIKDLRFQSRGLSRPKTSESETVPDHPTPEELDDIELSPTTLQAIDESIAIVSDPHVRGALRELRIADMRLRLWRLDQGWTPCPRCGDLAPPEPGALKQVSCRRCRLATASARR